MTVTLELTRPKSVTVNPQNTGLSVGTVVETDTSSEESFFIPVTLASIDPPSFTVTNCTTTNNNATVTTTGNGFASVNVGDPLSGTGIATSTTVSAKTDNNTITLSQNATASGTVTLTFDPPAITPTVYGLRVKHSRAGSTFGLTIDLMTYDGTLRGTVGTATNATKITNLVPNDGLPMQINIDSFLTNLRVPQST
ncbi:MAG: hypothetical protein ACYTXA_05960 [Nostoc sp.]